LSHAVAEAGHIVPLFILDKSIYEGRHAGSNRNRFLIECLQDLRDSLREKGGDLIVREGHPQRVLEELINDTNADAVYYTADYSPAAVKRDKQLQDHFDESNSEFRSFPGRLIVSSLSKIMTKGGTPHKVFTPFFKSWQTIGRRELARLPSKVSLPSNINLGSIPKIEELTVEKDLSEEVITGGETAARKALNKFISDGIDDYHQNSNDMAADKTSRLSPYLHFGCLSPLEIETKLPDSQGARAWHRQLAWREFYHYVLFYNPSNSKQEFQQKYRHLKWGSSKKLLNAWQEGKTGYPAVDAAMRQLNQEGWMHNRGRLIVGSFLTKDLWLDWRLGESYFMRMLLDGDQANNNGNWQWIASVGVDPAPVYRRLYNPASQRNKYDPTGDYVRRYIPELRNVPDKYLSEPWKMPKDVQRDSKCIIGKDYPEPIVDHKEARAAALNSYRSISE
jgi:deoxyribodipyrimidine photo-lyase